MENTKITGNEPYFPTPIANFQGGDSIIVPKDPGAGITIRQQLAAMALQGMLSNSAPTNGSIKQPWSDMKTWELCSYAVEAADALIRALNEPQP